MLHVAQGSIERLTKKRDNLFRKLDESNPNVFVNHLELLDISENCHSSSRESTEKEKKKRGKNASKENMTPKTEKIRNARKI